MSFRCLVAASCSNTRERLLKNPVLRLFPALERNFDSTRFEGKVLLPLYVQELLNEYHVSTDKKIKNVLKEKKVSLKNVCRGIKEVQNGLSKI